MALSAIFLLGLPPFLSHSNLTAELKRILLCLRHGVPSGHGRRARPPNGHALAEIGCSESNGIPQRSYVHGGLLKKGVAISALDFVRDH